MDIKQKKNSILAIVWYFLVLITFFAFSWFVELEKINLLNLVEYNQEILTFIFDKSLLPLVALMISYCVISEEFKLKDVVGILSIFTVGSLAFVPFTLCNIRRDSKYLYMIFLVLATIGIYIANVFSELTDLNTLYFLAFGVGLISSLIFNNYKVVIPLFLAFSRLGYEFNIELIYTLVVLSSLFFSGRKLLSIVGILLLFTKLNTVILVYSFCLVIYNFMRKSEKNFKPYLACLLVLTSILIIDQVNNYILFLTFSIVLYKELLKWGRDKCLA